MAATKDFAVCFCEAFQYDYESTDDDKGILSACNLLVAGGPGGLGVARCALAVSRLSLPPFSGIYVARVRCSIACHITLCFWNDYCTGDKNHMYQRDGFVSLEKKQVLAMRAA